MIRAGLSGVRLILGALLIMPIAAGCGGGKLIPRDLKDYLSAELHTERRNVDVTQPFRTTVIYRVPVLTRENARHAERALVIKVIEFSRAKGVTDFLNDSLMFLVRLETDPDVNMKWLASVRDMRETLEGKMSEDDFIERCAKEENWPEELG